MTRQKMRFVSGQPVDAHERDAADVLAHVRLTEPARFGDLHSNRAGSMSGRGVEAGRGTSAAGARITLDSPP
jgi:hypothetical protein